jgi:hypothetical protein
MTEHCIGYGVMPHDADEVSRERLCPECLGFLLDDIRSMNPGPDGELRFGWRRAGFIGPLPAPQDPQQ